MQHEQPLAHPTTQQRKKSENTIHKKKENESSVYTLLWSFTGLAVIRSAQTEKKNKFCIGVRRHPTIVINLNINLSSQISITYNDTIDKTDTNNKIFQLPNPFCDFIFW